MARTYTVKTDRKRRILLRGSDVHDQYQVRHREDGVIELRPQIVADVASISARTYANIVRSMEALERGEASALVDIEETFLGIDDSAEAE